MSKKKWMGVSLIVIGFVVAFISCAEYPSGSGAEPPDSAVIDVPSVPVHVPTEEESRQAAEEMRLTVERHIAEMEERARTSSQTFTDEVPTVHGSVSGPPRRHLTSVQSAPSVFPNASGPFNRRWSEERLIGNNQALYDACLLVFSRAVVNEANWIHRECGTGEPGPCDPRDDHNHAELDGPAMFQVFRYTRYNHETLLGAMRRHMNYVTEEVEARRPRTRWISELDLEGNRPPHFQETDSEGNPLNWERDYLPRWRDILEMSRRLFAGRGVGGCSQAPLVTWGGRCEDRHGACDDSFGWNRGLVPYECAQVGTGPEAIRSSNRFWCSPGTGSCPRDAQRPGAAVSEATNPEPSPDIVEAPSEAPSVAEIPEHSPLALAP